MFLFFSSQYYYDLITVNIELIVLLNVQMAGRGKKPDDERRPAKQTRKPPKAKKTTRTKKVATFRDSRIVIDRDDQTPTPPMRQVTIPAMAGCDRFWSPRPGSDSETPTASHDVVPSATTPGSAASIPPPCPPRPVRNLTISVVLLYIFVRIMDLTFLYYLADASTGPFF